MLVEARVEHDVMKAWSTSSSICRRSRPRSARRKVLGDHVARHFEEEENELFAKLRHSKLDLAGLGEQLAARQLELGTAPPDKKVFAEGRRVLGS